MGQQPSEGAGARRQRRQAKRRPESLKVTLTEAEAQALAVRAAASGRSRQRYLVESALGEHRTVPERRASAAQFSLALRQLRGLATNINQLALQANASGHIMAGTADALAAVAALESQLTEAIDGLR